MKKSSIVDSNVKFPMQDQLAVPSWGIVVFLIVTLVVLKKFMYIKDVKRDGK
jgi:hypothetical protein